MKTYEEYREDHYQDLLIESQESGMTPDDYFLQESLDKLEAMGNITDYTISPFEKKGQNQRIMAFDAYAFDESDKSVVLIMNYFTLDKSVNLTKTDLEKFKSRMLYFIEEAYANRMDKFFDMTDDLLRVGKDIGRRMKMDYVKTEDDDSIEKIKLFIVTNAEISGRISSLDPCECVYKRVDVEIWSLHRFYDLLVSGEDHEAIEVDVSKYGVEEGLPCIKADMTGNPDYDAYLAIIPGKVLKNIYWDYGSRLLEGNVRAFLSAKGKINKGIRKTIKEEPTKFFAYNNGIACTASEITLSDDGLRILKMKDLQIINGGQTTASLNSAVERDRFSLNNIFVPMKLTVVKEGDYAEMVQNISRYANSQNKVTESDFFSNHDFHRTFEILSKKIWAPAKAGELTSTVWYYERARGKYQQEQFKLTKKSEKDAFAKKYPKNQVIKKEELAKYFVAAELQLPHIVSRGSQRNMAKFAEYIDKEYNQHKEKFNDEFFKRCICYAILYRTTDKIMYESDWYTKGGYKLNVVPYTVSKLMHSLPSGKVLDFEKIWKRQELYPSLVREIERLTKITNDFIGDSNGVIVSEYAKREETWNKYKAIPYRFSDEFLHDLVDQSYMQEKMDASAKDKKLENSVNVAIMVFDKGGKYWSDLMEEGVRRGVLGPKDVSLLRIAASIGTPRQMPITSAQAKYIWRIRERLEKQGVIV